MVVAATAGPRASHSRASPSGGARRRRARGPRLIDYPRVFLQSSGGVVSSLLVGGAHRTDSSAAACFAPGAPWACPLVSRAALCVAATTVGQPFSIRSLAAPRRPKETAAPAAPAPAGRADRASANRAFHEWVRAAATLPEIAGASPYSSQGSVDASRARFLIAVDSGS